MTDKEAFIAFVKKDYPDQYERIVEYAWASDYTFCRYNEEWWLIEIDDHNAYQLTYYEGTRSIAWGYISNSKVAYTREARLAIHQFVSSDGSDDESDSDEPIQIPVAFHLPLPIDVIYLILSFIPESPLVRELGEVDKARVIKELIGYSVPSYMSDDVLWSLIGSWSEKSRDPEIRPYLLSKYSLAEILLRSLIDYKGIMGEAIRYEVLLPLFVKEVRVISRNARTLDAIANLRLNLIRELNDFFVSTCDVRKWVNENLDDLMAI